MRASISPAERLALTLRFLATGNSQVLANYIKCMTTFTDVKGYSEQVSISFGFRVGRSTVSKILKETCEVLWEVLQPVYVRAPSSEEEWKGISRHFEQIWSFPHCIGIYNA